MSKIVVLAEKPSVGKDIARVLGCKQAKNGYIEGNKYIVTWALGHLVSLSDPERYDKKYATWNLEQLPIIFDRPKFQILKPTAKQYNTVKTLLARKDVSELVIATDAGREGELVARLVILKTGFKKPIKRLWISSITDRAIKDGFNNLVDGKKYYPLYMAAMARAEADWIVGINATRALTTKYNSQLSCGRVQTPTLQMICDQDDKIKNFKPKEYYTLLANANNVNFTFLDQKGNSRLFELEKIAKIEETLKGKKLKVTDIKKQTKKSQPKPLYDLTTLQREANALYNYSAKQTLDIIQSLYEYHKVVTYPRTDSKYLTTDMIPTLKERVHASNAFAFSKNVKINFQNLNTKAFVNNSKVTDHHAIIPTEQKVDINRLDGDEQRIYKLIVQRFYSVLLPACVYEDKVITAKIDQYSFKAKGQQIIDSGWRAVYEKVVEIDDFNDNDHDDIHDQILSDLKLNNEYPVNNIIKKQNFTSAPKPFNEGSLLAAMENPSRFVDDKQAQQTLQATGGIGTVATRADIIEKLQSSFLIAKQGQAIHITNKGRQLLQVAPDDLKSPLLTATWEHKLSLIEKSKLQKDKFMNEIKEYTKSMIFDIKNSEYTFTHDNMTKQVCSKCNSPMLFVEGKKGKMLVCSNIECKNRVSLNINPRMQCPNCRKKLQILGDTFEKQALFCNGCGYRESLVSLLNKNQNSNSASKSEVKKLLKAQKEKPETISNPFADMFK